MSLQVEWIKVRNWDKWQSYRRDRGQPPWIKVHRCLMRNPEWVSLTDAQRGQLVAMWLLAADRDGVIPASPHLLKKLCFMDSEPDLQVFAALEFIEGWSQDDADVPSSRRQGDETETETEAETEEISSPNGDSPKSDEPLSDLWGVWIEELGGDPPHPRWTDKRRQKLRAFYREHLSDESDPMEQFRRVLRTVKQSDHHMSTRSYQMPESLFRSEERRDRWMKLAMGNTGPNGSSGWEDDL